MHRNAEIWASRYERIERLKFAVHAHFGMAQTATLDTVARSQIQRGWEKWHQRWAKVEQRVWQALCIAKGWRKA